MVNVVDELELIEVSDNVLSRNQSLDNTKVNAFKKSESVFSGRFNTGSNREILRAEPSSPEDIDKAVLICKEIQN